jgi:pyruvate/2-oxoglutarate dehydrogenase complex dihydrolipoamide acyltransferase (E2) component
MAHDVIMPMLGMAQETGIIVSWKKKLGDQVKAGDILMEVETDKSTIELEAGHDGFLTSVRAETGVAIPVGQVVAVISSDQNDVEVTVPTATPAPAKVDETTALAVESPAKDAAAEKAAPAPAPAPAASPRQAPRSPGGKVLASPKARREAEARGIDLGRLVRLGVPEPIHVADLDKAGAAASLRASRTSQMRVRIEKAPFDSFLAWLADEAGVEIDGLTVWAAFASGSLRTATAAKLDDEILVRASRFPGTWDAIAFRNPDLGGLTGLQADAANGAATLTVLDLTDTPLTEYRPAGERPLPHLTVANGQDAANLDIYLEFDPASLPEATAFEFLKNLADRAHTPLRHLI